MPRVDGQITALAGEFFVAAELLRRGLQVSMTFGNAKAIDLIAYDPETLRTFTVQVKALRAKNYFLIDGNKINGKHHYVFVLLNTPPAAPEYFIVPGAEFAEDSGRFGKYFKIEKMPGISPKDLEPYRDNWRAFL
jgi:hypothetical protein